MKAFMCLVICLTFHDTGLHLMSLMKKLEILFDEWSFSVINALSCFRALIVPHSYVEY